MSKASHTKHLNEKFDKSVNCLDWMVEKKQLKAAVLLQPEVHANKKFLFLYLNSCCYLFAGTFDCNNALNNLSMHINITLYITLCDSLAIFKAFSVTESSLPGKSL